MSVDHHNKHNKKTKFKKCSFSSKEVLLSILHTVTDVGGADMRHVSLSTSLVMPVLWY